MTRFLRVALFVCLMVTGTGTALAQDFPATVTRAYGDTIAHVVGAELITFNFPPSALSIRWGYPQYIKLIADTAMAAGK